MTNTSTIDDNDLTTFLQYTIAAVSGLPGNLVRPRWQSSLPIQPPVGTNWAAVGIAERIPMDYPYERLSQTNPYDMTGVYTQQRHEKLEIMTSFYGPNAGFFASQTRDALYVEINRYTLDSYGIKVREVGRATTAPELIATAYLNRVDMPISLVRQQDRTYAIYSILSGQVNLINDDNGINETVVVVPPANVTE